MITNRSLSEYFSAPSGSGGSGGSAAAAARPAVKKNKGKTVLIMDEVDGMSGNEDRGGLQTFIAAIKTTKVLPPPPL